MGGVGADATLEGPEGTASDRGGCWSELRRDPLRRLFALVCLGIAIVPLVAVAAVPLDQQPRPDAQEYADGAYQIRNGNGFRTRINERDLTGEHTRPGKLFPSRYPPGFPLALAPFVLLGDNEPSDAQGGARAFAVLLVVSLFVAAWSLGGPIAAGVAALISAVSPFAESSARFVLSDAFAAALTLLTLAVIAIAWSERTRGRARSVLMLVAGALAGYSVLTRLSSVGTGIALVVAVRKPKLLAYVALGAAPFLIMLGAQQWSEFGSPTRTGYDYWLPTLEPYAPSFVLQERLFTEGPSIHADKLDGALMEWTCPCSPVTGPMGKASNAVFYPAVLLGLYWIYFPPLFSLLGIWEIFRRRRTRAAQFAAALVVVNLLLLLPYFYQGARLIAPAAYVLLAFSAACVAQITERLWVRGRSRIRCGRDQTRSSAGELSSSVV